MISNEQVSQILIEEIPDAKVMVDGDGYHYQVTIITDSFEGMSKLKRQQLVYAALGKQIASGQLHALTMKTMTPNEWEQNKNG
jgi:acid stress-induced BolA-like protein IbaG/YrbA